MCSCDPQIVTRVLFRQVANCFCYPEGDRGLPTYLMCVFTGSEVVATGDEIRVLHTCDTTMLGVVVSISIYCNGK
jgi:hypothetical protein